MNGEFAPFFERVTTYRPHDWQCRLASRSKCEDLLIRIPTGFGKTAGVVVAWLFHRVHRKDAAWPRRLVLCLPMRTLVEQTYHEVAGWLQRAGLAPQQHAHVLLGGMSPSDWHLEPERESVLVGTQDMLLSRALNRGYGAGRARWPMEYGLLNVDCLWVMDEIQLMDVGLATSAQLQAFASSDERAGKLPRPRRTWWMSATLQRDWLRRAPSLKDVDSLPTVRLDEDERTGELWNVDKNVRRESVPASNDKNAERWADLVEKAHQDTERGITLAVANTVKSAVALYGALKKRVPHGVDLRLVHSRFRGEEREKWTKEFLSREACKPGVNRVIVATQVVEAGVDVSADALVTEIAPWAALVQRFGRCARYGGRGRIIVVDRRHTVESARSIKAKDDAERAEKRRTADRETVLPYELPEIEAASEAVDLLMQGGGKAGPAALEAFEELQTARQGQGLLPRLYPYAPLHVLTRRELHDLFDTTPDLTGADVDVSRYVREGDERDVTVWWWPIPEGEKPHPRLRPSHDALCRVPIGEVRNWLLGRGGSDGAGEDAPDESSARSKKPAPRAWVWSYLDGAWERLEKRHLYPGQTILVDVRAGGYDSAVGFTGGSGDLPPVNKEHIRAAGATDAADAADEQDELSEGIGDASRQYKTIATHGAETAVHARSVALSVGLQPATPETKALEIAALAHDVGKAHPAFAAAIKDRNGIAPEIPLAKAPKGRWHKLSSLYDHGCVGKRPGFRHEFASALALLELIWRAWPEHPALQGGREHLLAQTVGRELPEHDERLADPKDFIARLRCLDESTLNLVLYLVMSHHGKVRATLTMSPRDQENRAPDGSLPIRGVRDGDMLPALDLVDPDGGAQFELPEVKLRLEPAKLGLSRRYGPSWVERVVSLRERYGTFQLAWLEALLRVADVRASQISHPLDPRLPQDLAEVEGIPENEDRDAELRRWIAQTLAAAAGEGDSPLPRARKEGRATKSRASRPASKRGAS